MRDALRALLRGAVVLAFALPGAVLAQAPITLHGAVQFNDGHAFNRALEKFQELTLKYYGKPINFVLHKNSELGLEKDYFAYMNQGISHVNPPRGRVGNRTHRRVLKAARSGQVVGPIVPRQPRAVNANRIVLCTINARIWCVCTPRQNCMLTPPAADQLAVSCTPLT